MLFGSNFWSLVGGVRLRRSPHHPQIQPKELHFCLLMHWASEYNFCGQKCFETIDLVKVKKNQHGYSISRLVKIHQNAMTENLDDSERSMSGSPHLKILVMPV